jgi:hypothetical protein
MHQGVGLDVAVFAFNDDLVAHFDDGGIFVDGTVVGCMCQHAVQLVGLREQSLPFRELLRAGLTRLDPFRQLRQCLLRADQALGQLSSSELTEHGHVRSRRRKHHNLHEGSEACRRTQQAGGLAWPMRCHECSTTRDRRRRASAGTPATRGGGHLPSSTTSGTSSLERLFPYCEWCRSGADPCTTKASLRGGAFVVPLLDQ